MYSKNLSFENQNVVENIPHEVTANFTKEIHDSQYLPKWVVMMSSPPGGRHGGLACCLAVHILDPSTSEPQLRSSICTARNGSSNTSHLSLTDSLEF